MNPKRLLVYVFEFVALPEATFLNHPELLRELQQPRSGAPLMHIWAKALVRAMGLPAMLQGPGTELTDERFEALRAECRKYAEMTSLRTHQRHGYTVHVLILPTPEEPPEAYFAAIVHRDDEVKTFMQPNASTRYFTLERSTEESSTMLCSCTPGGDHLNFGAGPVPDETAFVEAVFEKILSHAQPAAVYVPKR